MRNLINKWLEIKRIKYEKVYCKHDWEEKKCWDISDVYTKVKKEEAIILYICKKCGEIRQVEI